MERWSNAGAARTNSASSVRSAPRLRPDAALARLRTPLRITAAAVLALLVAVVALAIATARGGDRALYPPGAGEPTVTVYVVRNWLHASLAVPTEALRARSGPAAMGLQRLPESEWVLLGWGDAKHFRERGETRYRAFDLIRSLVVLDNRSVVAMDPTAAAPTPRTIGRKVLKLRLSQAGFDRLARRLDRSFATDGRGAPRVAGRGREPDSLFFYSREGADFAHACNHWIAELLDAAGVPTTPVIDTITAGLALDLRLRAGATDVGGRLGRSPDLGRETPPVYSGRFDPLSEGAESTGAVSFEAYRVTLGAGSSYSTDPVGLVRASAGGAGGRTWAALLRVPADSLVEVRNVEEGARGGFCGSRSVDRLALGFRANGGLRYEVAVAALTRSGDGAGSLTADAAAYDLCAVHQYVQP